MIAVLAYSDHTRHFAIKSQLFLCFCCCVIIILFMCSTFALFAIPGVVSWKFKVRFTK